MMVAPVARVFVSSSSSDRSLSEAIGARLGSRHELFMSHSRGQGIQAGADWERTLYERLEWSDVLVCLVTTSYVESRWCFAELAIAKAQGRLILPLIAERGINHPLLESRQQLDYVADPTEALARLEDRL